MPVNVQHFLFWRRHARATAGLAAFETGAATLTGAGEPLRLDTAEVTADFFSVLGVQPQAGRGFLADEEQPGRNHVAVITDRLWHQRFGASPGLVGSAILLGGVPHTVVGVLPASFRFPRKDDLGPLARLGERVDLFRPLGEVGEGWAGDYDFNVFARLRPGASAAQAAAELDLLENRIGREHQLAAGLRVAVVPLREVLAAPVRTGLLALFAGVGLLLVIVCANLANLVLARSTARARELAIRIALGASRASLERAVLAETLLLAAAGGLLGIAAAGAALRAFVAAAPVDLPRLDEVSVDARAWLFAFALSVACGVVSGLLPARRIAALDPQAALRAAGRTFTGSGQALRLREALVGCEVALSAVLLVFAGLLTSSMVHLANVDRGFSGERAVAVTLRAPSAAVGRDGFFDRTLERLRGLPGVRSAAFVSKLPLTGESSVNHVQLEGADRSAADPASHAPVEINVRFVSADYFQTLGIPLLRGRGVQAGDAERPVAVVSERLAAKLWPGRDPLGKRFTTGARVGKVEVVGVVKDVHNARLDQAPTLIAYVPYWRRGLASGDLVIRTAVEPTSIMAAARGRIRAVDPSVAVPRMRTMAEIVSESLSQRRFQLRLAAGFALAALLLAVLGIYGVVSYSVAQSRAEIGVRMALGAQLSQVVSLVLGRGLRPVAIGAAVGIAAAVAGARLLRSLLYGVTATDPVTLATVAAVLATAAGIACLVPALSAARTDPARVLHDG
jgi:putative ABC transport system permease protein